MVIYLWLKPVRGRFSTLLLFSFCFVPCNPNSVRFFTWKSYLRVSLWGSRSGFPDMKETETCEIAPKCCNSVSSVVTVYSVYLQHGNHELEKEIRTSYFFQRCWLLSEWSLLSAPLEWLNSIPDLKEKKQRARLTRLKQLWSDTWPKGSLLWTNERVQSLNCQTNQPKKRVILSTKLFPLRDMTVRASTIACNCPLSAVPVNMGGDS